MDVKFPEVANYTEDILVFRKHAGTLRGKEA